ncbi:Naphthalene 1,2-dioxygenase system, ferredoxin component [compost metagenome]
MTHSIEVPASVDLGIGKRARVQAGGADIALFNVDGQIYAIDDSCPHSGASLLFGKLEGRLVQCPAHGLRFDLATGCMRGGGMKVRAYPVEVVEGRVRIALPNPDTSNA